MKKKNAEKNKQWTNVVPSPLTLNQALTQYNNQKEKQAMNKCSSSPLTLNQTLTQYNNQKGSKVRLCWVLKVGHP